MGTFMGHALPGSFFMVFATWWTIQMFRRYYNALMKGGDRFISSATFPCSCLCGQLRYWECEGFMKVFFTTIGFIGEIVTGFDESGKFAYWGNAQHATMFFFFWLDGIVDILVHHKVPFPHGIEYIALALSFIVEAVLFKFHLHGRSELDVTIHMLLLYTVYACVLATLLEMKFRRNVLVSLCRAFFLALQGSWFWHAGFVLYNPFAVSETPDFANDHTDKTDTAVEINHHLHDELMKISMVFTWHMAAILVVIMAIGSIIGCIYRFQGRFNSRDYDTLQMKLIKKDTNGHTIINLHDDSESDIEFERSVSPGLD